MLTVKPLIRRGQAGTPLIVTIGLPLHISKSHLRFDDIHFRGFYGLGITRHVGGEVFLVPLVLPGARIDFDRGFGR